MLIWAWPYHFLSLLLNYFSPKCRELDMTFSSFIRAFLHSLPLVTRVTSLQVSSDYDHEAVAPSTGPDEHKVDLGYEVHQGFAMVNMLHPHANLSDL
jgi:hypothetical protein